MDDHATETAHRLTAHRPGEVGVAESVPDVPWLASAHLLANEARHLLEPEGFTDDQILRWAEAFLADQHSGDLDTFLDWVAEKEGIGPFPPHG